MRNLSIKALKSMWMPVNSGPFVVPIQSGCPHDLGQQVEFCAFQDSYFWESFWDCSTFDGNFGKMDEHELCCSIILMFPSTFRGKKKRLEIHYLLFGTMLSEPLTSSSSKKQGGGEFFRTNRWWFILVVVCLWALILGDCWLWGL